MHKNTPTTKINCRLPLTDYLGEFPDSGLDFAPDVVVTEAEQRGAHEAEISFQISAGGLNLGPCILMAANVATRLRRTPVFILYI